MVAADPDGARVDSRRIRLPARAAAANPAPVPAHEPYRVRRVHHVHRVDFRHLRILRRPAGGSLRPRTHHRRMPGPGHRPALPERVDHQHRDVRDPALVDGNRRGPHRRSRRRIDSRYVAAAQPRTRIRIADDRSGRRKLSLQLRCRRDAADLSHLAIADLDHGILRGRDVHPDRALAVRSESRTAHADHENRDPGARRRRTPALGLRTSVRARATPSAACSVTWKSGCWSSGSQRT